MSEKRITANHRNCKKSTGPRTDRGKSRSSLNAFKHGLRSNRALFPGESSEIFDIFRKSIFDLLEPEDLIQADMTQEIVSGLWRLRRASLIEDQLFAYSANRVLSSKDGQADTVMGQAWIEYDMHFCRLRRYQVSIERSVMAMLSNIRSLHGKSESNRGYYQAQQAEHLLESVRLLQKATSGYSPVDIPKAFEERLSHVDDSYIWPPKRLRNQPKPVSPSTPKSSRKSACESPVRSAAPSASPGCSATRVPEAQEATPQISSLADKLPSPAAPADKLPLPADTPAKPADSAADSGRQTLVAGGTADMAGSSKPPALPQQPATEGRVAPSVASQSTATIGSGPVAQQSCNSLSPEELAAKKEAEYLDWLRLAAARRERQEMEKGRF